MVYKIRNKAFFWTRAGWKNNWHPKNFNSPRPSHSDYTVGVRCRYDHHSFLRANQLYRNISRTCKQYFYGDKRLEELFQLGLRSLFHIPFYSECLTDQIKHGGERRMVDQADRDWELVSYNTHPYQMFAYEVHNKQVAYETERSALKQAGSETNEDKLLNYFESIVKEEQAKTPSGKVPFERMNEILQHVIRKARAETGRPDKDQAGEFNDFLEKRRPFVSPNPNGVGV